MFIEEEGRRVDPYVCEGDMQAEVKSDMKKWAIENDMWPSSHYANIIDGHAEARGWTQTSFDEMELKE